MEGLPGELLGQIYTDKCISHKDLKSLRLVCRSTADHVTNLLFKNIGLSRLKIDREAFLNIAARPHLARAVRVLTWHELAEFVVEWDAVQPFPGAQSKPGLDELELEDTEAMFSDIQVQLRDACWIPSRWPASGYGIGEPPTEMNQSVHSSAFYIEEFRPLFHAALDALNLHTVISQPMHSARLLIKSPPGYPLTAQLVKIMWRPFTPPIQMNEGLHSLLGPAMMHLSTINKPITRLHFTDEDDSSSILRFNMSASPAFAHLTHIYLCIGRVEFPSDLGHLCHCLRAAISLTELTVNLQFGSSFFDSDEYPYFSDTDGSFVGNTTVFDGLFCQFDPHWPRLESLHVDEVWLSAESFPKFVGKHAKSLRRLRIHRCTVACSVITGLANIEGLQLKEFIILSLSKGAGSFHIPEARLLAFVNSIGSDFELGQNLYTNANVQVYTHAFGFELDN